MDECLSVLDDCGVEYSAVRSNGKREVRFADGGETTFRSERQQARGLSCDVFVLDEFTAINDEIVPISSLAHERALLVD